ncbi:MAG: hypothetical protein VX430_02500 [Pseudomonadota bacterium]|nr:hypothetical protein [Pseudomonadota bacterium]
MHVPLGFKKTMARYQGEYSLLSGGKLQSWEKTMELAVQVGSLVPGSLIS